MPRIQDVSVPVLGLQRARGRPKDTNLRQRILEKARDLFLEHGFQVVSMDGIASAAEVSNRTVYSHFDNKEKLLAAVFELEADRLRPRLPVEPIATQAEFEAALQSFGEMFVGLLTNPSIVSLGRIVIAESSRYPEMAKNFFEWGPRQTQEHLSAFLRHGQKHHWINAKTAHTSEPLQLSQMLLALWLGTWHIKQQLGLEAPLSASKIKSHVRKSLQLFLDGAR